METDRTQRHSLILKDVAYLVSAHTELLPHADKLVRAYEEQFLRRLKKGQCFQQPYFGCREFVAHFEPPDGTEEPINLDCSFGCMLRDIDFIRDPDGLIFFTHQDRQPCRRFKVRLLPNSSRQNSKKVC
ncbi:hypothetical protein F7734_22040 [Scytonema sp. UIC 10036]|nr:hypothetical protein [Scytonema sp. UIC 10036]